MFGRWSVGLASRKLLGLPGRAWQSPVWLANPVVKGAVALSPSEPTRRRPIFAVTNLWLAMGSQLSLASDRSANPKSALAAYRSNMTDAGVITKSFSTPGASLTMPSSTSSRTLRPAGRCPRTSPLH